MDEARILFEKAEKSSFLKYGGAQNWRATFDWLIKDSNAAKVMDGNYDDQKCGLGVNKTERAPDYSDTSRYTNIGME